MLKLQCQQQYTTRSCIVKDRDAKHSTQQSRPCRNFQPIPVTVPLRAIYCALCGPRRRGTSFNPLSRCTLKILLESKRNNGVSLQTTAQGITFELPRKRLHTQWRRIEPCLVGQHLAWLTPSVPYIWFYGCLNTGTLVVAQDPHAAAPAVIEIAKSPQKLLTSSTSIGDSVGGVSSSLLESWKPLFTD